MGCAPFDLAGQEGIIVVSGGNIERGQERVASVGIVWTVAVTVQMAVHDLKHI